MGLVFDKAALKSLRMMQPKAAALMIRLKAIAAEPSKAHSNVKALRGLGQAFRLRQGDWRAAYELDRKAGVMRVVRIGQRGQMSR